jgi:hypothetical protein
MERQIGIQAWVYGEGLPANAPVVKSDELATVDRVRLDWEKGKVNESQLPWSAWSYQERYRFISNISPSVSASQMKRLDEQFAISATGNNEVLFAWLEQAILKNYVAAYDELEKFLITVGRRKFVAPLYEAMIASGQRKLAVSIYSKARPNYHAVTAGTIDELLKEN